MSTSTLEIDGVQISSPGEYMRYLDLTRRADHGDLRTKSRDQIQSTIKLQGGTVELKRSLYLLYAFLTLLVVPNRNVTTRLTALIIGINSYRYQNLAINLRGAVADANAIEQYLKKTLRVPQSRIRMLTDEEATRKNIIRAFSALENDRQINWGDAILIYYAGHGQQVQAPKGWATENIQNRIQSIVPHDFDGQGVHVIPDYTLGWLIYKISRRHGNNITVIFDCCHAGSGTRADDPDHLARTAYLDNYAIPENLDIELGYIPSEHGGNRSATPLSGPDLSSHIFLAACSAIEIARETRGRGKFTVALEAALKAVSPDQISYIELLDRLGDIVGQNPQLEGNNRHRLVFDSKATVPAHHPYKIDFEQSGRYVLQAGAADGICKGAQFTVYASYADIFKEPLAVVIADVVRSFKTLVQPMGSVALEGLFNTSAYAVQTHAGEQAALNVYMTMTEDLMPAFGAQLLQQQDPKANQYNVLPVEDPSVAHLKLQRAGDEIRFIILDPNVRQYDLTECIHKAPAVAEDLRPILQGAAHYYYHLKRSSGSSASARFVQIEFFKLKNAGKLNDFSTTFGRPNRAPDGENLVKSGIVSLDLNADDDSVYGLVITNRGTKNLYPNLFYFDNSDLSINSYYSSPGPSQYEVDSPLPSNGKLNIGFGNAGATAFEFYIPDGRDVDVGFLKCFFSTKPLDLSKIQQDSPFHFSRAIQQKEFVIPDAWDSITIPVIQRRVN